MPKGVKGFQKGHSTFVSKETYKKMGEKRRGIKFTEEHKRKISESNKGNTSGLENGKRTRFKNTGCKGHKTLGVNGYRNIHKWVVKELGQPEECVECGKDGLTGRQIHWANLSGEYKKDISDWMRLCVRCHFIRDKG